MQQCPHYAKPTPESLPLTRPRSSILRDKWKISLPATISATIDNLLMDPLRQKPRYSARSKLVEQLLRRYIRENNITLHSPPLTDEAITSINPEEQADATHTL